MATQFLEGELPKEIDEFRPIFERAVNEAKKIVKEAGVTFYDIVVVRFYTPDEQNKEGDGCKWDFDDAADTATIAFSRTIDPEALTHEVAHSFFHPSPLHDSHNEDPKYGDKFCNAFRYVLHPNKGNSWMAKDGGPYDAHALVKKCEGRSKCKQLTLPAAFREYFVELCEKKRKNTGKRILDSEGI